MKQETANQIEDHYATCGCCEFTVINKSESLKIYICNKCRYTIDEPQENTQKEAA